MRAPPSATTASKLRRCLGIAAAMLAVLALAPAIASAHAVLLRATPSSSQTVTPPPQQVQLLFSEPLDPVFSRVLVQDAAGQRVDQDDSRVDPDDERLLEVSLRPGLTNGIYTVAWRSLSAIDVHPDEGRYSLFVGVPVVQQSVATVPSAPTATPETTIGRWWFYIAASLFGGVLVTWKFAAAPALEDSSDTRLHARLRRRVYMLIVLGGVLLILGTLFSAVAQAGAAANVPLTQAFGQPLADLLLRGRFASIWWPRLGLEIASLALIISGGIDGLASECALATLPAVLLTSALTSHGAALSSAGAGIGIDWLHIVGATAWVGGLVLLAACLPVIGSGLGRQLLARFARLALIASAIVLLSGLLQGALEVGTASALIATLYGQLLLVKVALLIGMLALAGWNEWRRRRASPGIVGGVAAELALGIVLFGVAALLSGTPPAPTG